MQRQDSDENNLFFGIATKRYQFTIIEEYIKFISIVGYIFTFYLFLSSIDS
jgi:hypothetical protein